MGKLAMAEEEAMTDQPGNPDWILERIDLGIQVFGEDGEQRFINQAAKRWAHFGRDPVREPDTSEWRRVFDDCRSTGNAASFVEQRDDVQQGVIWLEHRFQPEQGAVLVLTADITRQRRAELALERSEGKFALAFQSSPVGIAISVFDTGKFLAVNDEAVRIYGYTREELIGRTSVELGIIDAETRKNLLTEMRTNERLSAFELIMHTKQGETVIVLFSWDVIEFDDQRCVIATIIDITGLRKLEEQNHRLQRMESIGALAGGIVHDLNNVLGPIMLVLGTLKRKLAGAEDRAAIQLLEQKCKRGADLVGQILTFARGTQSSRAPVHFDRIAEEVLSMVKPTFPANITVVKRFPGALRHVDADATQLIQILMNLLVNARDAMPDGGTITIAAENVVLDPVLAGMTDGVPPGEYVLLKVTDTGAGMSPEVKERIFNPFFTTKEEGKGTGLGLSTVAAIVKAHHGELQVTSEPGRGTEFRVYFPATEMKESDADTIPDVPPETGNGEIILFVDDDAIVREVVKIALESGGYQVRAAADGVEAIAMYGKEQERIAAVVTDMDLPLMDGIMLAGVLRRMDPAVRIIGSSGTPDLQRFSRFRDSGIVDFLPKPYTADMLLRILRSVLNRPPG